VKHDVITRVSRARLGAHSLPGRLRTTGTRPPRQSLRLLGEAKVQGPDLQNILRQSYDNGKITIYLYYGRLKFAKHLTQDAVLFLCTIQLQNRKIV